MIVSSDGLAIDVRRNPLLLYIIAEKLVQITYSLYTRCIFIIRLYNGVRNNLGLVHSTREIAKTRFP